MDGRGKLRGNCTGVPFHPLEHKEEFWCFLENVNDPLNPQSKCYEDAKWSFNDGRFWSVEACSGLKPGIHQKLSTSSDDIKSLSSESQHDIVFDSNEIIGNNRNDPRKRFVKNDKMIAANGKPCVFPFKYDGETYSVCTLKDSENGIPWCATGIDEDGYVVDGDWGECTEKDSDASQLSTTTDSNGNSCVFPFKYDGQSFSECTTLDSDNGQPWCATLLDSEGYIVDGEWRDCREQDYSRIIEKQSSSRLPRKEDSATIEMKTAHDIKNDLTNTFDPTVDDIMNLKIISSNGKPCIFPFKYDE